MPHTVREWLNSPVVVMESEARGSFAVTPTRRRNIRRVIVDSSRHNATYRIVAADRKTPNATGRKIVSGWSDRGGPYRMERSGLLSGHGTSQDPPFAGRR
jgi:hypothetical protein